MKLHEQGAFNGELNLLLRKYRVRFFVAAYASFPGPGEQNGATVVVHPGDKSDDTSELINKVTPLVKKITDIL